MRSPDWATLAKGPVAVFLAGIIVVAFAALRRDWRLVLRTLWLPGIALYLAVTLPWFIAVQRANPEFFRVFILEHNLQRYATDLYRHKQPFWYYIARCADRAVAVDHLRHHRIGRCDSRLAIFA